MLWVPFATALVLGLVVLGLHFVQQRRQVRDAKSYRGRFIQLVAQLETLTRAANALEVQVRGVKDPRVLDYYEGTLKVLETLLAAVRKIPPFGADPSGLDSAFFLVRDCRERLGRTQQAFQDAVRGRAVNLEALHGAPVATKRGTSEKRAAMTGCYFCSRPVIVNRFSQVKVKIDGQVKEVMSCKVCKEELETTKKVKVLYFMKDGHPIHWSSIPDYKPSEDFWNINKPGQGQPVQKSRRLEIVRSPQDGERKE
jgi:hypothetical protein